MPPQHSPPSHTSTASARSLVTPVQRLPAAQEYAPWDIPLYPDFHPPNTGGSPLPAAVQRKMGGAFGQDFSRVRVHHGPQAKQLGALAFTRGEDLYFAPGRYAPGSEAGLRVIGHELAHVVQQRAGRVTAPPGLGAPINADPGLEAEADALGARAARGEPVASHRTAPSSLRTPAYSAPIQRVTAKQLRKHQPNVDTLLNWQPLAKGFGNLNLQAQSLPLTDVDNLKFLSTLGGLPVAERTPIAKMLHELVATTPHKDLLKVGNTNVIQKGIDAMSKLPSKQKRRLYEGATRLNAWQHLTPGSRYDRLRQKFLGDIDAPLSTGTTTAPVLTPQEYLLKAVKDMWLSKEEAALMVKNIGEETAGGMIEQAYLKENPGGLRAFIGQLGANEKRLSQAQPELDALSLIVDTNTVASLLKPKPERSANEQGQVDFMRELETNEGLTDLRIGNITRGEALDMNIGLGGITLDIDRTDKDYTDLLAELKRLNVGNKKGAADRGVVADAFYAQTKGGPSRFATQDQDVIDGLLEMAGINPKTRGPLSYFQFLGNQYSFSVTYKGRELHVYPMPVTPEPKGSSDAKSFLAKAPEADVSGFSGGRATPLKPRIFPYAKVKHSGSSGVLTGFTHTGLPLVASDPKSASTPLPVADVDVEANQPFLPLAKTLPDVSELPKTKSRDPQAIPASTLGSRAHGLLQALPRQFVGTDLAQVQDYMQLILDRGFETHVVGGAVRDAVIGKKPNDVDITTTMPVALLDEEIRGTPLPKGQANLQHGILPIAQDTRGLDIVNLKGQSGTSSLSLGSDLASRDFTMNSLYYDPINDEVLDPTGKGVRHAQKQKLRILDQASLETNPSTLGRFLRFATSGYGTSKRDVAYLQKNLVGIMANMKQADKLRLYNKMVRSPADVAKTMQALGFTEEQIRAVFPGYVP